MTTSLACLTRASAVLLGLALPLAAAAQERTVLKLHNGTGAKQTVGVVMAALGASGQPCDASNPPVTANQLATQGFCSDVVNAAPPVAPYAGKCQLEIAPGATIPFPDFPGTCLSGNVSFGAPDGPTCPTTDHPTGVTTAEFTLNTLGSNDETVDISLVNGYNANVEISMSGGADWKVDTTGDTTTSIANQPLGQNIGNPGVYPPNCTICTGRGTPVTCPAFGTDPSCQASEICNVERSLTGTGGTVTISLTKAGFVVSPEAASSAIGPVAACADTPSDAAAEFFANLRDLAALDGDLADHPACEAFCRRAKRACRQVAQLARNCVDRERHFATLVASRACAADADPAACRDDLKAARARDRADTHADFRSARAFCRGDVLEDCLARCSLL